MFTFTVFDTLLFESRSVLSHAQQATGTKRVKVSVRNQKSIPILMKLLEKWLKYKLRRFFIGFNFFYFGLTVWVALRFQ